MIRTQMLWFAETLHLWSVFTVTLENITLFPQYQMMVDMTAQLHKTMNTLLTDMLQNDMLLVSVHTKLLKYVHLNSMLTKHSIFLNWSEDWARTFILFDRSLHVNLNIWSLNLICTDIHGNYKIMMMSCPPSSAQYNQL